MNRELIFNKIGYYFGVLMVSFDLWLLAFLQDTSFWIGVSGIAMASVVYSSVHMMQAAVREKCNVWEIIFIRVQASITAGWVTTASIVNAAIYLKTIGWNNDEETWGLFILFVAFGIYSVASYQERNPLYGLIFIWVLCAIPGWSEVNDVLF